MGTVGVVKGVLKGRKARNMVIHNHVFDEFVPYGDKLVMELLHLKMPASECKYL